MKKKGFTLVELLAVIVVLAIIALIATPTILGVIEKARNGAAKASALNYIDAVEKYMVLSELDSTKYPLKLEAGETYQVSDVEYKEIGFLNYFVETVKAEENTNIVLNDLIDIKGEYPTSGVVTIGEKNKVESATLVVEKYNVLCESDECTVKSKVNNDKESEETTENDSIIGYVEKNKFTNDSITEIVANDYTYSAHVYTFEGNQVWDTEMIFGDDRDVATETEYAKNMVIVKVNGDLTINEGVTVRPYYTEYGGPKGFMLYVTGTLTNNGTIDNSHGAKAEGEDVYLWQNEDGSYEYIPAVGGDGGEAITSSGTVALSGNTGASAIGRQTGGGGSGSNAVQNATVGIRVSGAGSAGTSYSGGTGGASIFGNVSGTVEPASSNGGAGGSATVDSNIYTMAGGAGNPGGRGKRVATYDSQYDGKNGTGGLLILYGNSIYNNASILSEGSDGGSEGAHLGGAGSGGGSINLFYESIYSNNGTVSAAGGYSGDNLFAVYTFYSGNGGTGSITTTKIEF